MERTGRPVSADNAKSTLSIGEVGSWILAAALVLSPLFGPSHARAAEHAMVEVSCYDCHDLAVGQGEPFTAFLGKSKRNMSAIKAAWAAAGKPNGHDTPDEFGCLYCHNSAVAKDDPDLGTSGQNKMRDASTHFRGKASSHPVGYNLATMADTSGHLLSTFDCYNGGAKRSALCNDNFSTADGLGDRTQELDCTDCHDLTKSTSDFGYFRGYPYHGTPLASNPFMLRTSGGDTSNLATGEYDGVCRRCHGSATGAVPGVAVFKATTKNLRLDPLTAHQDGSDGTTNVMKEKDGTLLRHVDTNNDGVADLNLKKQCTTCHDAHYSSTNKKLFDALLDVSNASKCTDCHFPGDFNNSLQGYNFNKYGHGLPSTSTYASGKSGAGYGCSSCHSVNSEHNPATPTYGSKMFSVPPDITPSKYGKDLLSVCKNCHSASQYHAHTGAGADVGCIDCHDEHAEGVGSTSNRYMIPQYLPNVYPRNVGVNTELSFFQSAGDSLSPTEWDYYVSDTEDRKTPDMGATANVGVCDNGICHAGLQAGTPPVNIVPLATFMTSGKHSNGNQAVASNCNSCHSHTDPSGSWGASASCDSCHADATGNINTTGSPRTHGNTTESLAKHTLHATSGLVPLGCTECHPHDGKTDSPTSGTDGTLHMDGVVNFGGTSMPGPSLDYAVMAFGGTCVAVNGCHDSESGEWAHALGLNSNGDACADCHAATGKTLNQGGYPPVSNEHTKHLANNAYVTGDSASTDDCADCHGDNADLGNQIGHKNSSVTIATSGAKVKISAFNSVTKTCTNSCHLADVASKSWAAASTLACTDCHAGTTYIGADRTGSGGSNFLPQSGLHDETPSVTGVRHDDSFLYSNGALTADCTTCHSSAPTNPSTAHINGTFDASIGANDTVLPEVFIQNATFTDGVVPTCAPTLGGCHTDQAVGTWGRKWLEGSNLTTGVECAGCHGTFALGWNTGAGTLVRPNMGTVGGPGAATQPHAYNWDGDANTDEVSPTVNHSECKSCHGMNTQTDKNPNYVVSTGATPLWNRAGFPSDHGNGSITINGPSADENGQTAAGAEYNGNNDAVLETSDYGCTKACHQGTGNANHNMGDSAWAIQYRDFGAGNCDNCHGYPPLNGTGSVGNYEKRKPEDYTGGGTGHAKVDHLNPAVLPANAWTPCLSCHPDTTHAEGGTVINRANVQVTISATYDDKAITAALYTKGGTPAAGVCTNVSCHGGQATPPWDGGTINVATQCTACHIAEAATSQAAATQWNSGWSGLHARIATVSLENHTAADASDGDITDSNACTHCHGLPAAHFTGLDTTAMDTLTDADFVATYDGTDGFISKASGTCAVTCHNDTNAGTPRWARKWSTTVTNVDGAECANCHGIWNSWVSGVTHRTDAGPQNTHGQTTGYPMLGCNECHAIGDLSYDFSPKWNNVTNSLLSNHGNEVIELNSNGSTFGRNGATLSGCASCHLAYNGIVTPNHSFTTTPWPFALLNNGQYSGCNGCHGNKTTGFFWPDGAGSSLLTYPDRNGRHDKHVTAIVNRLNDEDTWNTGVAATNRTITPTFTLTKLDQQQVCEFCHNDPTGFGGTGHYPAGYGTDITSRDTAEPADVSAINKMWTPYAADGGGVFAFAPLNNIYDGSGNLTTGRGCNAVDCHKDTNTTAGYEWYGATPSSCTMCHAAAGEPDVTHQSHVNASASIGYNAVCTDCHGAGTTSGSGPTAGHINGTVAIGSSLVRGGAYTITYTGVYPTKGTCNTNICHNRGYTQTGTLVTPKTTGVAYTWGTQITGCDACHDTAYNLLATGSHARHLTTTTGGADARLCTNCHSAGGNPNHLNGSVNMGGTVIALDATYTGNKAIAVQDSYGTCGTNLCHNNGTDSTLGTPLNNAYAWNTPIDLINSCTECHNTTTLATQAHAAHLNASLTFGITTISCASCHGTTPEQQTTHTNGSVTLSGLTYAGGGDLDLVTPNNYGTCGVNACHNDGTGGTQHLNPLWSATGLTCVNCHQDGAAMISAGHNKHLNNGYTSAPCIDCHTPATASTHINGSTNFDQPAKVTYAILGVPTPAPANGPTANGTCTTVACHNRGVTVSGAAASAAWNVGGTGLACDACHYHRIPATSVTNTGWSLVSAASHNKHFDKGKLCADCHTVLADTAHITVKTTLTDGAIAAQEDGDVTRAGMGWVDGTNTCTSAATGDLGCHATGSAQWGTPTSADACIECHTNTSIAAVNPTTGLHGVVPSVSGQQHNQSVAGGCEACHTATPSATHQNAALDVPSTFAVIGKAGTGATVTCNNASCHLSNSADWAHKWVYNETTDSTAATGESTACAGCHGDFENGWNAGVLHRTTSGTLGTHGDQGTKYNCYECHVLESAAYSFAFGTGDWGGGSQHGDGTIQVNANTVAGGTPALYNQANGLCEGCHTPPDTTHNFVDTAWPISTALTTALKISADCNTCHGGQTAGQTPILGNVYPDSITADTYPDKAGAHAKHMVISGVTCANCHPGNPPAGHGQPPTAEHLTPTTAEVTRTDTGGAVGADVWLYAEGWSAVSGTAVYFKTTSGTNDTDAYYTESAKTCSNINCHGGTGTTTPAWYGDGTPPAVITLGAATGTGYGSVNLTWNAVGDDGSTGTATAYDIRYNTVAITAGNWDASTQVNGEPTPLASGNAQNMTVSGLTGGTTYFFAIKSGDEVPNWGAISNSPSAPAKTDTFPPTFAGLASATDANSVTGGTVNLTWSPATDAEGSNPITYTIWYVTPPGAINYAGAPNGQVQTTQGNGYQVTGLVNGGLGYRFAVRAQDVIGSANRESNIVTFDAIPTIATGGSSTPNYILTKRNTGTISTSPAVAFNATGACGTAGTSAAANTTPATIPYLWRGGLETGVFCAGANALNFVSNSNPNAGGGTAFENMLAFYTPTTYASQTLVTGRTTGTSIWMRGSGGTEDVRVWLAASNPTTGALTMSASSFNWANIGTTLVAKTGNLSTVSVTVPAGARLAFLVTWADTSTTTSNLDRIMVDNVTGQISQIAVTEAPVNTPPSAPTVTAPANGSTNSGTFNVTWTVSGADPEGDTITYDVYGSINGGTSFPYVIATNVPRTTTTASWNTVAAGIGLTTANATVRVRVIASDTKAETTSTSGNFTVDNRDTTAPNAVTTLAATTGGLNQVNLTWTAVGDDAGVGTATSYDIRYNTVAITSLNWAASTTVTGEPVPKAAGQAESFTVNGLTAGNTYFFGIRVSDEVANLSGYSNSPSASAGGSGGGGLVCGDCHLVPPASGAHAAHVVVNIDYTDCEQCHGVVAGGYTTSPSGTHNNGSVSFVAGITYSDGGTPGSGAAANNDTCLTTICHSPGTGYTSPNYATWGTPTSVDCTDCHYYQLVPTAANAAAYVPPASTSHGDHFSANKTCTACHPDNSAQTTAPRAHLTAAAGNDGAMLLDQAVAVADEALVTRTNMLFSDGVNDGAGVNNVCTNNGGGLALGCHASGSADWEVAFASTACLNCHTNETTPAVNPSTGLHNYNVATRHDDTLLTGNCINCHSNTATRTAVSSLHQDGVLQTAATATFGWNATNVTSYTRATDSCQAAIACHTDGGTWNRKWTAAVDADPLITDDAATATVCRNCHGSFFTGWNIVVPTDHVNPDADNNAGATPNLASSKDSHGECTKCHGWGAGAYTAAMHNGAVHQLQMNSDLAYQDAGATVGQCSTNCHGSYTGATALAMNTDSGWTTVTGAFGGVGCGDCHNGGTRPGAANNSGAHDAHGADDTALVNGGAVCQRCHGNNGGAGFLSTAAGTHGIGNTVNWAAGITYSTAVRNDVTGTCGAPSCHGSGTPIWNDPASVACGACHGKTAATEDRSGMLDGGAKTQGSPPVAFGSTLVTRRVGKHLQHVNVSYNLTTPQDSCTLCHNVATADHADLTASGGGQSADILFQTAVTGAITYDGATGTCAGTWNTTNCHGAPGAGAWDSGFVMACSVCHDTPILGAPRVTSTSTHTKADGTTWVGCTECHSGHANGITGQNDVEIPTRKNPPTNLAAVPTMNNSYSKHGYAINLGGTATAVYAKSTEAELCWGCHYTRATVLGNSSNEFGVNNNSSTGSRTYNYGTLDSWGTTYYGGWWKGATPAVWTSGTSTNTNAFERFTYKTAALSSMHGSNYKATTGGTDPAADIRCSYCHDVHDTGALPAGVPYLRGTWTGNPFPEDGAPQSGQTYPDPNASTISALGLFPRVKMNSKLGGFQINQNNTTATTGITAASMAGLCETCHGGGDGTWTAAEIDTIDQFPSENNWSGTLLPTTYRSTGTSNGHANSVLFGTGGTSSNASDIYNEGIRNPLFKVGTADGVGSGSPSMRFLHNTDGSFGANAPYGFRGHTGVASSGNAWNFAPQLSSAGILNTSHRSYANSRTTNPWGSAAALTVNTTAKAINTKYHQFPCSKCHNPHASRLPRLMITNCLDIRHETFYPAGAGSGVPATEPWTNKAGEGVSVYNKGMTWAQTTAAVNCHRWADSTAPGYASPTTGNHRGAGWNKVTPW